MSFFYFCFLNVMIKYISNSRILTIIFRIIIGLVFIFSGITKLYPIEPFEFAIVDTGFFSWNIVSYLSRIFISVEIIIGIFLIINLIPKFISKLTLLILIFFTGYLFFLLIKEGNNADCGCFGDAIKLSPIESIIKNIILIILTIPIIYQKYQLKLKYKKLLSGFIILGIIILPFILNPIFYGVNNEFINESDAIEMPVDELGIYYYNDTIYDLSEGKKILVFLSLKCKYCKLAVHKLSIIQKKFPEKLPIYLIFNGDSVNFPKFKEESKMINFPYMIIDKTMRRNFFRVGGTSLPAIYFLKDSKVIKISHFIDLDQSDIEYFQKL